MTTTAQPPSPDQLPRLTYLLRVMQLCIFPLATVVLGNTVQLGVPQARETLLAQSGYSQFDLQDLLLCAAYLYWIAMAWYTARLLVDRRFNPDTVGRCRSATFAAGVQRWLPRGLVLLGGLPMAVLFVFTPGLRWLGAALAVLNLGFFWAVVMRRQWLQRLGRHQRWLGRIEQANAQHRNPDATDPRLLGLAPHTRWFMAAWLVVSLAMFLAVLLGMEAVARTVGSPALLTVALASWTLFGGILLTYLPKSYGWPALNWLPAVAFVACAPFNDNHPVARPSEAQAAVNTARPTLEQAFTQWLAQRPNPQAPVLLVAIAGGASRAAYWATSSLGKLEDEARRAGTSLADNTFVISGVSGGSLGAASFVASLEATGPGRPPEVRATGNALTGRDHLATAVGFMLYPDLVQRLLPWTIDRFDRSRALEEVWARDWQRLHPQAAHNPWTEPFTALHQRGGPGTPMLALNTAALSQGLRVFQSDFRLPGSDGVDLLDTPGLDTTRLTLAQAVHNSARFPYISPAGRVEVAAPAGQPAAVWDHLGDGGYVEASGALTVLEVLRVLRDRGLVRDCSAQACSVEGQGRQWVDLHRQVRVLLIDNQPVHTQSWSCLRDAQGVRPAPPVLRQHDMAAPDLLGPLVGLLEGRTGRGDIATHDLIALAGGCDAVAELRLPAAPGLPAPSMNWMLNQGSRDQMDQALDGRPATRTAANCQLEAHLAEVRRWLGLPSGPAVQACAQG